MLGVPTTIPSEVFAELPGEYRRRRRSAWAEANQHGRIVDSFLEGPCFNAHGALHVVDIPFGRIFSVSPDGAFSLVIEYDGEPNGLKILDDGRAFIADYRNGILALDLKRGTVTPVISRRWSERFKGVNDLCFAKNGDLYFTDQGQTGLHDPSGHIYRLTTGGRLDLVLANVPSPNGLVLDQEERNLYVAVTRANAVWRLPLLADGTTTKVGVFIQLSGGIGPDGVAIDENGGLIVAHPGLGKVWLFDRQGEPTHRIGSARGLLTTNVAFGGEDSRMLYITESETGTILRARMPVAGMPAIRGTTLVAPAG